MDGRIRTLLFVPGVDRRRVDKALSLGADAVAIDLEDAVALAQKPVARTVTREALAELGPDHRSQICVRINGVETGLAEVDLEALVPVLGKVDCLIVPMVETPHDVRWVADRLDDAERAMGLPPGRIRIIATAETARGVLAAPAVAVATPRLRTLLFGPADMAKDLGLEGSRDGAEFLYIRSSLVVAARAAGLEGPIDGPFLRLDDDDGCLAAARHARDLGFQGKMVLHPRQLPIVADAFRPTDRELERARAVVEAFDAAEAAGISSIRLDDGTFVDYPVAQAARDLLRQNDGAS